MYEGQLDNASIMNKRYHADEDLYALSVVQCHSSLYKIHLIENNAPHRPKWA